MQRALRAGFLLCLVFLAGCGDHEVTIRVTVPDEMGRETPVAGLRLFLLPYDRDSLIGELERTAPSPRPDMARLDSLLRVFREPFTGYVRLSAHRTRLERAVDSLEARLRSLTPEAAGRRSLADAAGAARDSLAQLEAPFEAARRSLDSARRLLPDIEAERRRVAAWEDTALASLDSLAAVRVREARRDPVVDSTDFAGWATVRLEGGPWWIVTRALNVLDPHAQWTWNLRITGDTVFLNSDNGRSRPRLR